MTEDDTFRILRRVSFMELIQLVARAFPSDNGKSVRDTIHEHGWTEEEFDQSLSDAVKRKQNENKII